MERTEEVEIEPMVEAAEDMAGEKDAAELMVEMALLREESASY